MFTNTINQELLKRELLANKLSMDNCQLHLCLPKGSTKFHNTTISADVPPYFELHYY